MHKWFARLHGHQAGMTWYQLSLFALSLYGAWSVWVAIDMYYQTTNFWDKTLLQVFAALVLVFFGSYLLTQWASIMHRLKEEAQLRNGNTENNSRTRDPIAWDIVGVQAGVALLLITEAASRASVFLHNYPNVSIGDIVFTGALTLYFCIPIFLGPAMARNAQRIRFEEEKEAEQAITSQARQEVVEVVKARIADMSDDKIIRAFGHLLPEGVREVTGELEALPGPKGGALGLHQADEQSQNGRTQKTK